MLLHSAPHIDYIFQARSLISTPNHPAKADFIHNPAPHAPPHA
ncbi:Protein of unknown function [Pyronema omphalodes CBS 100304]|uniref:Uncharacterized protein n=1 Tax=Pyronema omphalodes (strain CBS 100304) TaxID=1076935 RepID=U4L0T3_PYROM|nr:Protein of unknown function [Pyronema omphalodes CBS 100304]